MPILDITITEKQYNYPEEVIYNGLHPTSYGGSVSQSTGATNYYTKIEVDTWRNGVTQTEMGYLDGVTSDIQTQLDATPNISGTPVDSYIAVFTDANTIEGTDNLQFDDYRLTIKTTHDNIYIGDGVAASHNIAEQNVAIGDGAASGIIDGVQNTVLGYQAGYSLVDADANVYIGWRAGYSCSGGYNVSIGFESNYTTTADYGVHIGYRAHYTGNGDISVAIGYEAGYVDDGGSCLFLGNYAGRYSVADSNRFYLDGKDRGSSANDKSKALMYGIFNTDTANQRLTINTGYFYLPHLGSTATGDYNLIWNDSTGRVGYQSILWDEDSTGATYGGNINVDSVTFSDSNSSYVDGSLLSFPLAHAMFGSIEVSLAVKPDYNQYVVVWNNDSDGGNFYYKNQDFGTGNGEIPYSQDNTPVTAVKEYTHTTNFAWTGKALNIVYNTDNTLVGLGTDTNIDNTARFNTVLGYNAGNTNITGDSGTYLGAQAGFSNTANNSIFIGKAAGYYNTDGDRLFIDNQNRSSAALEKTNALIYGVFNSTVSSQELHLNAGIIMIDDIPTSDPSNTGQIWNDSGTLKVSA